MTDVGRPAAPPCGAHAVPAERCRSRHSSLPEARNATSPRPGSPRRAAASGAGRCGTSRRSRRRPAASPPRRSGNIPGRGPCASTSPSPPRSSTVAKKPNGWTPVIRHLTSCPPGPRGKRRHSGRRSRARPPSRAARASRSARRSARTALPRPAEGRRRRARTLSPASDGRAGRRSAGSAR